MAEPQDLNRQDRPHAGQDIARAPEREAEDSHDSTLDAVRLMMTSESQVTPEAAASDISDKPAGKARMHADDRDGGTADVPRAAGRAREPSVRADLPQLDGRADQAADERAASPMQRRMVRFLARLWRRVSPYVVNRKTAVGLGLALVIWWRPWLIPGLIFVAFWIGLIVYLTVGPDRLAELAEPIKRGLAKRYPDKAEALRERIRLGHERLERLVAKLPAGLGERISLPELGARTEVSPELEGRPDPFERLAADRAREPGRA